MENIRQEFINQTGLTFDNIQINGVHLEYIQWLEKKVNLNNEMLETLKVLSTYDQILPKLTLDIIFNVIEKAKELNKKV